MIKPNKFASNYIDIDMARLKEFHKTHSLSECSKEFGCSESTIKRKLRAAGVDTSIHNTKDFASLRNPKFNKTNFLSKDFLIKEYIINNKDTKVIANENNVHYSSVRKYVQLYKIKKDKKNQAISMKLKYFEKTGYWHPGSNPENFKKAIGSRSRFKYKSVKTNREYVFKSLHELCYAMLLDFDASVDNWDYKLITVPYIDRFTGKFRTYMIDFSVQSKNGDRWIEVKPNDKMIPLDKRLYASRQAKKAGAKFSGITDIERKAGFDLFKSGFNFDNVECANGKLKYGKCLTMWFKNKTEILQSLDHYAYTTKVGRYYKCVYKVRNTAIKVS